MDPVLNKNNIIWIVVATLIGLNLLGFLAMEVVVRRTTNMVIHKLEKEYSPSPYGPGLDPDRVNPDVYHPNRSVLEMRANKESIELPVGNNSTGWEAGWEVERSLP